jgi:hypothetical protein
VSDAFACVLGMFVVLGASFYTFFNKMTALEPSSERGIVAKMAIHRHLTTNIDVLQFQFSSETFFSSNAKHAVFSA